MKFTIAVLALSLVTNVAMAQGADENCPFRKKDTLNGASPSKTLALVESVMARAKNQIPQQKDNATR